ncbi:MAG TPA: NAD-dependent DNA ligase LigA [Candidatus Binatia bacterium]|nr:NAD-dependent DNA ligase LigA [Candidatus Binatia bacterium]
MNEPQKQRAARLRELINDYRYNYHVLNKSIMSEAAADSLKHELSQLEAKHPELVTSDSPTQRVAGQPLPGFKQIRHSSRMLSLNDVFNQQEIEAWLERITKLLPKAAKPDFFVDLKMDGLACALVYENGSLTQAVTRGDGFVGEDVTANVRTIESIPLSLRRTKQSGQFLNGRTEIRGEIVMYKRDFDSLNQTREKQGQPKFANPRNLAAGTIRQLDPALVAARPLQFHAYDLIPESAGQVPTNDFAYKSLRDLGLIANPEARMVKSVEQIMDFAKQWEDKRRDLPFNTDGLVIKLNDRQLFAQLGVVGKAPRGAVALKYSAEEATTVVKDIVISIGRTGAATPVAVFDPVQVAGTTVQHASLHNADEIARKDVRVGDTVIIFKAGDIIPQLSRVLLELRPKSASAFDMEAELKRQYPELEFVRPAGEAVYRVKGVTGKLLLKKALEHFASKSALDIDGMGEKNVAALVDAKLVDDLADIYNLNQTQVEGLDRFAKLSASNLIKGIDASRQPDLARFVYGLGIRHVGVQTAIDLVNHFGSLDKLAGATLDQLMEVEGVGQVVAESILGWFADPDNQELLKKFEQLNVKPTHHNPAGGKLSGKSFVVTGTLGIMSREEAAERIRSQGGTFQSSVGNDTDYLVVGANVGASKLAKAKKLGTKQISETELLNMLSK